jgi:outer membrane protein, heavy metal efflux system
MRRTAWPLAFAAVMAAASAPAQAPVEPVASQQAAPTAALTLPRALELAKADHRELAAAQREVDAANAARDQATSFPNPQLEVQQEGTRRFERETTVLLSQPIELGGKRVARTAAAELSLQAAQQRQIARSAGIEAEVTGAFFEALIAQERVQLVESSVALASSSSTAAVQRVAAGKVPPIDETRAKVAESTARLELVQAKGQLRAALVRLAAAMGDPSVRPQLVDGSIVLPPVPTDATIHSLLRSAPSQRQVELEADRQAALARVARAQRVPDVTVSLGAKRIDESGHTQAMVGLSVPLPIFNTGRNAETEARLRAQQAADEAAAAAVRLEAQALQTLERLRSAQLEVQTLEHDVVPGAEDTYRVAARGFELGKFAFLDVLDAQRTLIQARTQRLRALAEAHAAAADLQRQLGTKIEATR